MYTIEPFICGGDAAFLSNDFDHLLILLLTDYVCVCVCVCVCVSPTPRVSWSRLDTSMPAKNSNASFGQELVIDVAEFSDSGRYQCTAVNTATGRPKAVVDFALTVECT